MMKTLNYYLLVLTLTHTSMYAMDKNVKIIAFDHEKHSEEVSALLSKSFEGEHALSSNAITSVLVKTYPATRSHRPETILGFISYKHTANSHIAIDYLIIKDEHQEKGYGRNLMAHV